jgi:hypothetical protein
MPNSRPSFKDLKSAVEFIAHALETRHYEPVADACVEDRPMPSGSPPARDYRLRAIEALASRHAGGSIRALYAGQEFPDQATTFKLGGHDRELGHVHVDFVHAEVGWQLKDIWVCR